MLVDGPKGLNGEITEDSLGGVARGLWRQIAVADDNVMSDIEALKKQFEESIAVLQARFDDKVDKLQAGDELPPGVMKMVKVFVAVKRKMQPGDKMAGRHGNKGVVSRIMAMEDMPHLEDGTPVDIVLNPLGVPSRMNVGQILETHLGWASRGLGEQIGELVDAVTDGRTEMENLRSKLNDVYEDEKYVTGIKELSDGDVIELGNNLRRGVPMATPVFDGAREPDVVRMLEKTGLDGSGQVDLYDGRTGENSIAR